MHAAQIHETLTRFGHRLIRAYNGDTFDPFFVRGHPTFGEPEGTLVLSCFYYALVVTPKVTLLLDNDGRGGMCAMTVDEVAAAWRTGDLLSALGTDLEGLRQGKVGRPEAPIPEPVRIWGPDDLQQPLEGSGGGADTVSDFGVAQP